MSKEVNSSKMTAEFYPRVKKEYQSSAKPFVYQFSLSSDQPKPKKFRIILGRFIEIFKDNMKDEFRFDDEQNSNYWDQLEKQFSNTLEMTFMIRKIYEGKQKKLRIYFALLLHNKKLFTLFDQLFTKLSYLYKDINYKRKNFDKQISALNFLRDGQFVIDSSFLTDYNKFREEEEYKLIMMKKQIQILLSQMVDSVEKTIKDIEKEKERVRIQKQEKQRKQNEIAKLKLRQLPKDINKKVEPIKVPVSVPAPTIKPAQSNTFPFSFTPNYTPAPVELLPTKQKPRHLKNSQHLYNQKYKDERQVFSYQQKPEINQNKSQCYECKQQLTAGFYIIGVNMNFCYYTGQWFCNQHICEQRIQIPYKAQEQFDLRGYYVNKRSYYEIKSYYQKPIIQIKYTDDVVKKNKKLYQFLVLRRQVHLMYDSICNTELMEKLFGNRVNYCLKENLFSLKNLYDIYNGHQTPTLEADFSILVKHFDKCTVCQAKKGRLCAICGHPPRIFSFQLKQTYSCKHCRKIFHRRCMLGNKCDCQNS